MLRPVGQAALCAAHHPTGYRYTGQRWDSGLGLYDYNARYYDPHIGRFISADTLVPDPAAPQAFNRYAYVLGNPLRYTDPTGHLTEDEIEKYFGFTNKQQMIEAFGEAMADLLWGTTVTWGDVIAYSSNESEGGIGYAMLLLIQTSASSEIFRGAFWGIAAVQSGLDYGGAEVTQILGRPFQAYLDIAKTQYYRDHGYDSIPINEERYGVGGVSRTHMVAGAWYDAAFWRPIAFFASKYSPGGQVWRVVDLAWSGYTEVTDNVLQVGHPLGNYLTTYPTVRIVSSLHPHHHNTYTFLAPRGIR